MSLTTFIALPEVKNRLKQEYKTPEIQCVQSMQIAPRTQSYGLTGTAFDYLMRFWIETINPDIMVQCNGEVNPCMLLQVNLDNVREQSIVSIWETHLC